MVHQISVNIIWICSGLTGTVLILIIVSRCPDKVFRGGQLFRNQTLIFNNNVIKRLIDRNTVQFLNIRDMVTFTQKPVVITANCNVNIDRNNFFQAI